jgi:hypothetical protein
MKRKKGKIKSVGVHPFQVACFNGAYISLQLPGLFTVIMEAMVKPLSTSSDINRGSFAVVIF